MTKTRLAVGLAAATLVVFVVVIALGGALQVGLAPWPGIVVAVLAVAAFAVSRGRRSLVVERLLAASGMVGVIYGLIRTEFLTVIAFPSPIFGIILGVPILGLERVMNFSLRLEYKSLRLAINRLAICRSHSHLPQLPEYKVVM